MKRQSRLHLTEHNAPLVFTELKATFTACGACRCPKTRVEWQSTHIDGPPPWCHRRSAFLALAETYAALGPQRSDAPRPV
ncbi:hypothetical protein [uncultured Marivita sp.]|uniref:hypothetical protein n=1 Tax=uncultured Marivita sp. TaxID=888080 RepID=UPI002639C2AB|nr:hypothetical protein [uncultured Marivita sp.]